MEFKFLPRSFVFLRLHFAAFLFPSFCYIFFGCLKLKKEHKEISCPLFHSFLHLHLAAFLFLPFRYIFFDCLSLKKRYKEFMNN